MAGFLPTRPLGMTCPFCQHTAWIRDDIVYGTNPQARPGEAWQCENCNDISILDVYLRAPKDNEKELLDRYPDLTNLHATR